ncbi:MAG: YicC family protein [Bacteroidales bacterium]|nr:YicC family protein [Bacteroidales bacterium]
MLLSMTGYGKAGYEFQGRKITIEIKTLNSKQLDIGIRMPNGYREQELEVRNFLASVLVRGKVEFIVTEELQGAEAPVSINRNLALQYFRELKKLSDEIGEGDFSDYLPLIMRMPDVTVSEKKAMTEEERLLFREAIMSALDDVRRFREKEGDVLEKDILAHVGSILNGLGQVEFFEGERMTGVRSRLINSLKELEGHLLHDANRLEQEMIYYLEKFDITEEKVRLRKHCDYFITTLNKEEHAGKKLGFIIQEMGREINTLGSKANHAGIQKLVVEMKDELEKIKEQLYNIL